MRKVIIYDETKKIRKLLLGLARHIGNCGQAIFHHKMNLKYVNYCVAGLKR